MLSRPGTMQLMNILSCVQDVISPVMEFIAGKSIKDL